MVRTFIGVEIEQAVIAEISQELSYLQHQFPEIKWVSPENLHITLKFLGNIKPNDLRAIFTLLADTAVFPSAFAVEVQAINILPNPRHPRIICAGCTLGSLELVELQRIITEKCATLGYQPDAKPYEPHITLGRVKKPSDACRLETILPDLNNIDFGITDVEEVIVYMSELKQSGAIYSPMYRVRLAQDG